MTALPSIFQVKRQALKENDLPEILLITRTEYVQPACFTGVSGWQTCLTRNLLLEILPNLNTTKYLQ